MMCTNIGDEKVVKKLCMRLKESEVCFKTKTNWRISTAYTEGRPQSSDCVYICRPSSCMSKSGTNKCFLYQ